MSLRIEDRVNDGLICSHAVDTVLYETETKYQSVQIVKTRNYGICLFLDGKMQSSEADEFIYHEALVHPAMISHAEPKRVLIIGGAEGATLREVLRYKSVEYALMIDIDKKLVNACKKHIPTWSAGAFSDKRAKVKFMDARKFLENTKKCFDVIIIDISEPIEDGPAYLLYTKEFYHVVSNRLTENGRISLQAGSTAVGSLNCLAAVYQTLKRIFSIVKPYEVSIPSFDLPWGFIVAYKGPPLHLSDISIDNLMYQKLHSPQTLRYFDAIANTGHFHLPKHVRAALENETRIIEDGKPLFVPN